MRDILLIIHFIGLLMGPGLGFSIFCIGMISKHFKPEYKQEVAIKLFPLRYIATIGLVLLIISGLGLLHPYFEALTEMPWLIAKLVLVCVISFFSGFSLLQMRAIKTGSNIANSFKNLALAGKINLSASMATVVCAVLAFH